jgi:thiol-disulfide isomerase/thioredoxin
MSLEREANMKRIFHVIIGFAVILISLNGQTALCATDANEKAPAFEFVTLSGEKINYDSLQGKVIILDFWDTHCNPCIKSMTQMEKFYQKYKDDKRVTIYLVNAGWEPIENAKSFANQGKHFFSRGKKYDLPFAYDNNSVTMKKFKFDSTPSTIIIDADFNIRAKHSGYIKELYAFLNKNVEQLLSADSNKVDTQAEQK